MSTCEGSKPRSTCITAAKLRSSRTEPISSTTAIATSPATSTDQMRRPDDAPPPRPLARISRPVSTSERRSAGSNPNSSAVTTATAPVNASIAGCRRAADANANCGGARATSARNRPIATSRPAMLPNTAITRLSVKIPDKSRAARTDRGAHREFLHARRAACQQRAREVGACREQQQRRRAEEQEQRLAHGTGQVILQPGDFRADGVKIIPGHRRDALHDEVEVALRGRRPDIRLEPADRLRVVCGARARLFGQVQRIPDVRVVGEAEPGRHHAHDLEIEFTGQAKLIQPRVAAEMVAPEALAHHRDRRCAEHVFLRQRQPAQRRMRTHHLEEIAGDVGRDDAQGLVRPPGWWRGHH